ncbi:LLM class flavin-dependent oxidoreductase [Subtercola lobariae]|uniref:FMNH2-utilizing oxygenase n=1 Tax=Subtercola lobariae TaxID=1588641 RepID=A0A917EVU0_9MICO|nr:LLM class flavin-dependent oxidoreductase [Subtercola lobariae]GGF22002.1 FMNH2-utilizing oxygenase [Subtercola lobariae]
MTTPLYLGVALDGAGWHPAAWREPDARPLDLFDVGYYTDLVRLARSADVDLVTIEDAVGLQTSGFGPAREHAENDRTETDHAEKDRTATDRTDEVRGRLDAVVLANAIAPRVSGIGLVPTVTTTHTEPFHTATALQTLDYVSEGWAGWRVQVSGRAHEAQHFGRRTIAPFDAAAITGGDPGAQALLAELFGEARDAVEVARRLWDSWQDDAIIREVETGRFIDRDKLHYIDFVGEYFSVKGPSIVPRSPQGQPVVFVLAHQKVPYELAVAEADIVAITPHTDEHLDQILSELRDAEQSVERLAGAPLQVWSEIVVLIEETAADARTALARLNDLHGQPLASDALVLAGSPAEVADQLLHWYHRGISGVRLRPARLPRDLHEITENIIPLLDRAGVRDTAQGAHSLRERLGFGAAPNRYAPAEVARTESITR